MRFMWFLPACLVALAIIGRARAALYATEANISIDRCASAWLILRFIDPKAEFLFLEQGARPRTNAVSFGFFGATYFNRGPDCTFTALMKRHDQASSKALQRMDAIVNDVQMWRHAPLSLPAKLRRHIADLRRATQSDDETLRLLLPTFDLLFLSCGGTRVELPESQRPQIDLLELKLLERLLSGGGRARLAELQRHRLNLQQDRRNLLRQLQAEEIVSPSSADSKGSVPFDSLVRVLESKSKSLPTPVVDWLFVCLGEGAEKKCVDEFLAWHQAIKSEFTPGTLALRGDALVWTKN